MAVIKMNLDEISQGFQPIEEGQYEAFVFEVKPKTFNSGSTGFAVTYNIANPPYQKRKIFDNLVMVEAAYWKLGQFYKAVTGQTGEVDIDTSKFTNFVGKKVMLDLGVEEQTFQGKTQDRNVVTNVTYIEGDAEIGQSLADALADRSNATALSDDNTPF